MTTASSPWIEPPPSVDDLVTDDGEPMESERHKKQMDLLIEALELHFADREDVYVGGNMFLYFSALQAKRNDFRGPDFFAVLDTQRRERKAWVVWEEGGRVPDVIIELLSETTADTDRGEKLRIYERVLHIPEVYLYDPFSHDLVGHRYAEHYEPLKPQSSGRLLSRALDLELGLWHGSYRNMTATWLRWFARDGSLLPTGQEHAEHAARERDEAARERDEAARERDEAARERDEAARERDEAARERDELAARLDAYEARFGSLAERPYVRRRTGP